MRAALFLFVLAIAPSASAQSRSWWSAVPGLTFLRAEGTGTFDRDDLDRWLRPRVARVRRCGDPTRGLVVEGSLTLTPDRTSFVVTRSDARVESCVVEELSGPPVEDGPAEGSVTIHLRLDSARRAGPTAEPMIVEVRVLEIEGGGRRLPRGPCGVAVAVVTVHVELLREVVGDVLWDATAFTVGACEAVPMRDRRIVGRELFLRSIDGGHTWWVDEDFEAEP